MGRPPRRGIKVPTSAISPDDAQRQAADPSASVWVSASAGSGKTKVLTDRVLTLLLSGTPPHRILCLTFTKAAAAEMANRINDELSFWTISSDQVLTDRLTQLLAERPDTALLRAARRLFAEVLDTPGGLKIQTIHSFCESLLARFPVEIRPDAADQSHGRTQRGGAYAKLARCRSRRRRTLTGIGSGFDRSHISNSRRPIYPAHVGGLPGKRPAVSTVDTRRRI